MAISQSALSYLPEVGITTFPNVSTSLESLKGAIYKVAELQKKAPTFDFLPDVKAGTKNPFTISTWQIGKGVSATGTVTLAGVLAADTVTINGLVYTAVAGAKADNTQFSIDGTDAVDAADLADSINNDSRAGTLGDVKATVSGAVVTLVQIQGGTGGNATTLASSNGVRLVVSGATFTGGAADDSQYTLGFVSEQQFTDTNIKGRAGLSTRRLVQVQVVNNAETFTVRSLLGVIEFIQKLEDLVASTGSGAAGDGTYNPTQVPVFTPYDTFQWNIVKLGAVYTVTPLATS